MFFLLNCLCKYVFENKVTSLLVYCHMWREEVHMQQLAKGLMLIKDAKLLDPAAYLDFISVLVALRKKM